MQYKVKFLPMESFVIEVDAKDEDDAYEQAYSKWIDIEPEMEIV